MTKNIADLRITYTRSRLDESEVAATPLVQFAQWFTQAAEVVEEPNAMVLSTANAAGEVSSRTVLLKGADARGLTFFTNYTSRKGLDIGENPNVSLCFPWFDLHRQLVVIGTAERLSTAESAEYFHTRPHGSRVGAWVSPQSQPIPNRSVLEARQAEYLAKWPAGTEVPMPGHWGGFLVRARIVEFWAGRDSRLHDRIRYTAAGTHGDLDAGDWCIERIAP